MSPVVGDSWSCREVAVYGLDMLESRANFFKRDTAIENDARNL